MAALTTMWSYIVEQVGLQQSLSSGWGICQGSHGKPASDRGSFSLPCFRSKQAYVCSSQIESKLPKALLLVPLPIQLAKGTELPSVRPQGWCTQNMASTAHSQGSPLLSPLPGAQVPTLSPLFPSYPILYGSFLQPWLYRSLSATLQLVFSENFSTCRCIFEVFMEVGESYVLLLQHLDLFF